MQSHHSIEYDVFLTGATGQIGRYLLRELITRPLRVVVVSRSAIAESVVLERLGDGYRHPESSLTIIQGNLEDMELPRARITINAAGFTSLDGQIAKYWRSNILIATRLAHHAQKINGKLIQLSSVAVAEFRKHVLREDEFAIPHPNQLTYSMSKVFTELAVESILPRYRRLILRIGDVIPRFDYFDTDWRPRHWLPILFSQGRTGFGYAPADYGVWLSFTEELAHAILTLMDYPDTERRLHLLGHKYHWRDFIRATDHVPWASEGLSKWMSDIILHGPEADEVSDFQTRQVMDHYNLSWTRADNAYWRLFFEQSVKERRERASNRRDNPQNQG